VKKLARLALFFSISFIAFLFAGALCRLLALHLQWIRALPRQPETVLTLLVAAAHWAVPLSLYAALLLSLNYASRQGAFAPAFIALLIIFSLAFSAGASLGLARLEQVPAARDTPKPLGGAGLILTQANTTAVLLQEPQDSRGPRVTAIPGQPLKFQAAVPNAISLPPLPLGGEPPWFLKSMAIDCELSAAQMAQRLNSGLLDFLIYAGALIFFIVSLFFIFKLSVWPLANLFLGCLAFRGILALETFFNSPDTQEVFISFLGNRLPPNLTVPLIFCAFGTLVYVYSILVYFSQRRRHEED
jgi:hypothetical protein